MADASELHDHHRRQPGRAGLPLQGPLGQVDQRVPARQAGDRIIIGQFINVGFCSVTFTEVPDHDYRGIQPGRDHAHFQVVGFPGQRDFHFIFLHNLVVNYCRQC